MAPLRSPSHYWGFGIELANGKTILCRTGDTARFRSLEDIDRPEVRVMVNPGGTNEQFAREHLTHDTLLVHQQNEEIPTLIAEGEADVMDSAEESRRLTPFPTREVRAAIR